MRFSVKFGNPVISFNSFCMSRIGKLPLTIPAQVQVQLQNNTVVVSGPKGTLTKVIPQSVTVEIKDGQVIVTRDSDTNPLSAKLHGTVRSMVGNMIKGVSEGFLENLEIQGVGYRVNLKGADLNLSLGYSHPILITPPQGVVFTVPSETAITISGIDKAVVGQIAATIRSLKKPEPYKGKGVRYKGEYVVRKEGKKAAK